MNGRKLVSSSRDGTGFTASSKGAQELVLLHGSLRGDSLSHRVNRSVLDLPLGGGPTLLEKWLSEASALRAHLGVAQLNVTLILDEGMPAPKMPVKFPGLELQIRRDPGAVRGTGGVLRDVLADRPEHQHVLVTHAAQLLRHSLVEIYRQLRGAAADVAVLTHADNAPAGFYLIRCGCLAQLPEKGFVDFKEQALPRIGATGSVRAVEGKGLVTEPLRTLADYLAVIQGGATAHGSTDLPVLIESGAEVHSDARLYNSVVLKGGVVESGAVIIESVVTASQRIATGQILSRGVLYQMQGGERVGEQTANLPIMSRLRVLLGRSREVFAQPTTAAAGESSVSTPVEPALAMVPVTVPVSRV